MPDLAPAEQFRVIVTRPDSPNKGSRGTVERTYLESDVPPDLLMSRKPPGPRPDLFWVRLDGEEYRIPYLESDFERE